MVRVVKEWPELTETKGNEEHKRVHIKDVFTSKSRRLRDWPEQINAKREQANVDTCASAQSQVSMVGKCEPQYSGESKHNMNASRNYNQESEMLLRECEQ